MATKTETHLIDDLDGGPADETIPFTPPGGKPRLIDLNTANAEKFRELFAPYVESSRADDVTRTARRSASPSSSSRAGTAERARNLAIRAWARSHFGAEHIAERGRLPREIVDAHRDAGYPATSGTADGEPTAKYAQTG